MKKRTLIILMALSLMCTCSLSACGKSSEKTEPAQSVTKTEEEPVKEDEKQEESDKKEQEGEPMVEADSDNKEEPVGVADPARRDVGEEEAAKYIKLPAPEGATDVIYNIFDEDSETPMVEMEFKLNGVTYYERAQFTSTVSIEGLQGDDASINLSGIYGNFSVPETMTVSYCDAAGFTSENGSYIAWIDVAPGVLYNLASTDEVKLSDLQKIADQSFVTVQGDD